VQYLRFEASQDPGGIRHVNGAISVTMKDDDGPSGSTCIDTARRSFRKFSAFHRGKRGGQIMSATRGQT
jgi:hypothetical protein